MKETSMDVKNVPMKLKMNIDLFDKNKCIMENQKCIMPFNRFVGGASSKGEERVGGREEEGDGGPGGGISPSFSQTSQRGAQ